MKIVGAVLADFVQAPTGGPSQLQTMLVGQPILERTLRRLLQIEGLTSRCLFVRPRDQGIAAETLKSIGLAEQIELLPADTAPYTRRLLLATARKWNLESWRGGLMGTTWFDEFLDPVAAAIVVNHHRCDSVLCLDGHQPLLDPAIGTAMVQHHEANRDRAALTFAPAPPGLTGLILHREAIQDIIDLHIPVGLVFSYRPELAQTDPIIHEACYHPGAVIEQTAARLTGDTRRSREVLTRLLSDLGESAPSSAVCEWLNSPRSVACGDLCGHDRAGPLPVEVELELTTADPLPCTKLRPRGDRVPRRQVTDLGAIGRLAEELAEYDDRLIFLGGHGDPLLHPRFAEVCRVLRSAGVFGVGLATPLVELSDENFEALFAHRIDVLEVLIDAQTAGVYRRVHGADHFSQVRANVERVERRRREQNRPQPVVVCSLTRCGETIGELEAFYDGWIREIGTAVIHGYNDYCGALPTDELIPTTVRICGPCRRLATRLVLHADGVVALCSQDFAGRVQLGNWTTETLREIWGGSRLWQVRRWHADLSLGALPDCQGCTEWGRP